jgi:hypothetical protein
MSKYQEPYFIIILYRLQCQSEYNMVRRHILTSINLIDVTAWTINLSTDQAYCKP